MKIEETAPPTEPVYRLDVTLTELRMLTIATGELEHGTLSREWVKKFGKVPPDLAALSYDTYVALLDAT